MCSVRQQELLGSIEITINREHVFYSTTFYAIRFAILYIKYTSSVHEKRSFCSLTSIESRKSRKKQNIIQATRIISSLWNFNSYSKNVCKDIEKYRKEKLYKLEIKFDFQIQFMVIFKWLIHCCNITLRNYFIPYDIFIKEFRHFGYINCKFKFFLYNIYYYHLYLVFNSYVLIYLTPTVKIKNWLYKFHKSSTFAWKIGGTKWRLYYKSKNTTKPLKTKSTKNYPPSLSLSPKFVWPAIKIPLRNFPTKHRYDSSLVHV